jgi:predicted glutamine amidotransferase/DNA-directed RNA polymerase subunit RPC12/RpoP
MCGIFGAVSNGLTNKSEFYAFMDALFVSTMARGRDSSGFAALIDGKFVTEKAPLDAKEFVGLSKAWQAIRGANTISMVGHTRQATHGSPSKNFNNHPFHGPRYSVVHNGGIFKHEMIAKSKGFKLETDCDSELILHFMEDSESRIDGTKATLENLDRIAMMAVATLDRKNGNVILFRTSDAPCFVLFVKRWNAYIFASTTTILNDAFYRLPDTQGVVETVKFPFDSDKDATKGSCELPAYHCITLTPDGKLEDEKLDCNFVSYAQATAAQNTLSGYAQHFAGQLSGASASTASSAVTGSSTTFSVWKCVICDSPIDSGKGVQVGNAEYACPNCVTRHLSRKREEKEKEKEGATITLNAEDILSVILPSPLRKIVGSKNAGEIILQRLQAFRSITDDYELREQDVSQLLALTERAPDAKMEYWRGVEFTRLQKMEDGEYMAYINFVAECV